MSRHSDLHTTGETSDTAKASSSSWRDQMPLKVGVMGGAGNNIAADHLDKAAQLGEAIATAGCTTGRRAASWWARAS